MDAPACLIGRLGAGGPWIGFVPTLDDGYAIVAGGTDGSHRAPATVDDLVALALAYFEDSLDEPPEDLAATHGDIGAIVRHAADRAATGPRASAFGEAVDAIDDGLAADVVIERLANAFGGIGDPIGYLRRRVAEIVDA